MALTPRLELRHSQSLVMTPQLQQAIKLLQLSNIELTAYVDQELEKNPLLESAETETEPETKAGEDSEYADGGESEALETIDDTLAGDITSIAEDSLDMDYDNLWNSDSPGDYAMGNVAGAGTFSSAGSNGNGGSGEYLPNLEETTAYRPSLSDHLTDQLSMSINDHTERLIAFNLIGMLDEAGYIGGDISQVADILDCDLEMVEGVLEKLQDFDPPGIFARDLAECLKLQLRDLDRLDPAMQAMLDNLDKLANHDIEALKNLCGVDAEDIIDMVAEIRKLNPKPAQDFEFSATQPIVPDVIMRQRSANEWIVELNSETLPKVLVNNHYYSRISRVARSKEEKSYISECLHSANWLVKSLHQRATTILKVATEIVGQQDAFFARGVQHLRPLVLRDIAEAIEMHESTVSRVTANKYIATPRGIYELKYFFTSAINSSSGGAVHSAESVRHRIKSLIDGEDARKTLSDDKIVEILNKEGIDIARRTVAKYREAMRIPSSVRRRREKSNPL